MTFNYETGKRYRLESRKTVLCVYVRKDGSAVMINEGEDVRVHKPDGESVHLFPSERIVAEATPYDDWTPDKPSIYVSDWPFSESNRGLPAFFVGVDSFEEWPVHAVLAEDAVLWRYARKADKEDES